MSASREKKARKEGLTAEQTQQQTAQKMHSAKTRKNVLVGVAIALVVVLIIGSIVLFKGPHFRKNSVAVTTGSHELSPVMVRYFYHDAFSAFYQNYGSMLSALYTSGTNFDEAVYDNDTGETWGDVLMEDALEQIRTSYAVYDEAVANGYVLSEDGESALESTESMLSMYAQLSGLTVDDYLRSSYGNGSTLKSYLAYQRLLLTVSYYEQEVRNGFTYTSEDLQNAYAEAPSDYDVYTYHSYLVNAKTDDSTDEEAEEADNTAAMDAAKETAENMAAESKGNLDRYLELCNEISGTENYTEGMISLRSNYPSSNMSDVIKDWITDPDRQEGDTVALEYSDTGYYVLYFVSSSDNDYDALNLRTVKISASVTGDDGSTTLDWDAAKEKLDEFQAEFEDAEDPLTALDTLASTYSDDSSTKYSGGAYETVHQGQFEDAVNEWLFSEPRKEGDTTVIQGNDAYYFLYVEGTAGNYRDYLVDQALRSAAYNEWYESTTADATVEQQDFGMGYVLRTLTIPQSSN